MTFDILQYLDRLKPDGGTNIPRGDHSCHCPSCDALNFKVNVANGKWRGFGCECSSTEAGKRSIRNALSPAINPNQGSNRTLKSIRPKGRRSWVYCDEKGQPTLEVHRTDDGKGKRKIWQKSLIDGYRPRELADRVLPYG